MQVRLKLRDRKRLLEQETRFAVPCEQRELRELNRQTTAAETGKASIRYEQNGARMKIVNHYHRRPM